MDSHGEFTRLRGLAMASAGLGFLSLVLFWCFPFGFVLSVSGLLVGAVCWALGVRGGARGERFSMGGVVLSAAGLGVNLAMGWGTYLRVFGL